MQAEHPLRAFRRAAKLSLSELAAKVGSTKASLSRIEQGHQRPSLNLVGRLKEATGGAVTADDFLTWPEIARPVESGVAA